MNMEFTINAEYLKNKIDLLKGITRVKSLMPFTRSVLMTLAGSGGAIRATDIEVSAITELRSQYAAPEPRNLMVAGGVLSGILEGFGEEDVTIFQSETHPAPLVIKHNKTEIGLAMADCSDFPEVNPLAGDVSFSIPGMNIIRGIGKVLYAVSPDETRYALTGILLEIGNGQFRMCATDGFRMALYRKDLPDAPPATPQMLIPGRNIKILKDIMDDKHDVDVVIDAKHVQFMTPIVTVIFRTIDGAFPDYESAIGAGYEHMIFVRRRLLLDCLHRVSPLTKKGDYVTLERDFSGGLTVSVETDAGYAVETIDCEYKTGEKLQASFNLKFLLDAIEHMDADEITIRYPAGYGAIVFDEPDYTALIMPIRGIEPPIIKRSFSLAPQNPAQPPAPGGDGAAEKKLKVTKKQKGGKDEQ